MWVTYLGNQSLNLQRHRSWVWVLAQFWLNALTLAQFHSSFQHSWVFPLSICIQHTKQQEWYLRSTSTTFEHLYFSMLISICRRIKERTRLIYHQWETSTNKNNLCFQKCLIFSDADTFNLGRRQYRESWLRASQTILQQAYFISYINKKEVSATMYLYYHTGSDSPKDSWTTIESM